MRTPTLFRTASRCVSSLTVLSAIAFQCAGCWSSSESEITPDEEPKELTTDKDPLTTEVPEADLVRLSKKLYQVGMFTVARDSFSSLRDRYPLGAYSTFAEIKLADTFFFNREYNEAAKTYESFLKNYPGNSDSPYVKLQAARSHVASAKGGVRDRQPLERGLALYDEVIKEYPNSAYQKLAEAERAPVIKDLAAYDREIINFYAKLENDAAVKDREQRYKERWTERLATEASSENAQGDTPKGVALQNLSDVPVPAPIEPSQVAVLGASSPLGESAPPTTLVEGRVVVQSVRCQTEGVPFAMIELTQLPPSLSSLSTRPETVSPTDGFITVQGTNLTARQGFFDCFGAQDIEILGNGDLRIKTANTLTLTALESPPRLLVSGN